MLHISTKLDDSTEALIHRVIGCCIAVHRELGPGLVEPIYHRALEIELGYLGIRFEREKRFKVCYRDRCLYTHRLDLVIEDRVFLELKAVDRIHPIHVSQVLSCLRISKLPVCLLVNFNVALLPQGIKRIVL
jgi:GxxExxY protein